VNFITKNKIAEKLAHFTYSLLIAYASDASGICYDKGMVNMQAWGKRLLTVIGTLKPWQVAALISVIAAACFWTGLSGGFQGDDSFQIVNNPPVHSLNVGQLFSSGTFWDGQSLGGAFYRPMMSTTFGLIYVIFGANPVAYHVVQLLLYTACAFVLYLFLKTLLRPSVALSASLLFLVHPVNTQVVYSIPCMQEPLFFLTGILALYVLARSRGVKGLIWAAVLLLLSLLSKETGIVFVGLALIYVGMYQRARVISFVKVLIAPLILYGLLRWHAVGAAHATLQVAPIDQLSFGERLLTIPSLLLFYLTKIVWPVDLATSYYWTERTVTWNGVVAPLAIVLAVTAGAAAIGWWLWRRAPRRLALLYVFFATWVVLGLAPYLQLIPLDMSACETWLFAMLAGVVGMAGVVAQAVWPHRLPRWIGLVAVALLIVAFGVRTNLRGWDYQSQYTLSTRDIAVTPDNYLAANNLAKALIGRDELTLAQHYAEQSIAAFPAVSNYTNLGVIQQKQGDFAGAKASYETGLHYAPLAVTYENLAVVYMTIEDQQTTLTYLHQALAVYPRSAKLLTYLAMQTAAAGNAAEAKTALAAAMQYGQVPPALVRAIMTGTPLDIPLTGSQKVIHLPGASK
jgi:protein O-mannosyl-transferase